MPTSQNSVTDRVSRPLSQEQLDSRIAGGTPTDTAKQNYTAIRYGNDHGSLSFGHIHKPGDVLLELNFKPLMVNMFSSWIRMVKGKVGLHH